MSRGVFVTDEQVRLTGNPNTARFLAQCLYWSTRDVVERRQGWFYKTRDEWQAETWLSRFQQEKARQRLRELGVLQERRERLNTGIRIWFRLDRRLLNVLINRLVSEEVEESTIELYDSTNKTGIKEDIRLKTENSCIPTESNSVEDIETTSNNSYIPEIQTNVCTSDKHCKTPEIDAAQYLACHPLIYQFIRTRLAIAPRNPQHLDLINRFCQQGMTDSLVAEVFEDFVQRHGRDIVQWYKKQLSVTVEPLSSFDLAEVKNYGSD